MKEGKDGHLDEREILQAFLGDGDLPAERKDHLAACPLCRREKERLENALASLQQKASLFTPGPSRPVTLERKRRAFPAGLPPLRAALGGALLAAVAIFLLWGRDTGFLFQNGGGTAFQETDPLMTEVALLVENPLPPVVMDMVAEEKDPGEEDFFHFVAPLPDEEPGTDTRMKGEIPWKEKYC